MTKWDGRERRQKYEGKGKGERRERMNHRCTNTIKLPYINRRVAKLGALKGHFHYGCAALRFAALRCASLRCAAIVSDSQR